MAVRMRTARLLSDPAVIVRAGDYIKAVHQDIVCHSCRCTVHGTAAYERNQNGRQVQVRAFFSVSAGIRHKENCRFNVQRTMDLLVARSSKIRSLDEEAIPLLAREPGGKKAEFRLHIMMDCLGAGPPSTLAAANPQRVAYQAIGGHFVRSDRVLSSYLNTTRSLLAFIARLEGSDALGEQVTFRYGKLTIRWSDFFFSHDRLGVLCEKLIAMNEKGESYHPVAFVLKAEKSKVSDKQSGDTPITLGRELLRLRGHKLSLFTTLYVVPDILVPLVQQAEYILVCAIPRRLRPIERATSQEQRKGWNDSLGLQVPISSSAQVCRFRPIET